MYERLSKILINELSMINGKWRERDRAADEAEKLELALEAILNPKRKEYDLRVGSFR